jgi:sugar lactone lactonase YvrE
MSAIEVAVEDAKATIGESPLWSPREGVLYWIDAKAPALFRYDPATCQQRYWPVADDLGGFALCPASDAALVALRSGIFKLSFATGALTFVGASLRPSDVPL